MLISESQVKTIIREEIEKLVAEGELDEISFADIKSKLGRGVRGAIGKAYSAAGGSAASLSDQERAAAEKATATQGKKAEAQRVAARMQASKTLDGIGGKLGEIVSLQDKVGDLIGSFGSGDPTIDRMIKARFNDISVGVEELGQAIDEFKNALDTGKIKESKLTKAYLKQVIMEELQSINEKETE